ncbi:Maf family nucleotide pyrophosphatase [Parvicella tangerina]|uniref:dTTP/UTP pyrophosphatase n=1 Tax=Parvicella tangerina TaxID=2829795 RepID=A0A916NH43_9FLAO|nr:Maf family nucleotide pyrophosphatase [Parvicella tangerina]CAG5080728.1 dTTP/UTP pyrophosphatase [Parvicella tangerina]
MLKNITNHYDVILASKSPRRQQLLKEILPDFTINVRPVDEVYPSDLKQEEIAPYLSQLKSAAFEDLKTNQLVITADTIVCLDDKVLGKPKDFKESFQMLSELSGNTHVVYSGVTIKTQNKTVSFYDATKVTFYPLSASEIEHYIHTCQPFDKAGSYGIQEWMGYVGIEKMEGEFYNVMGLPLHRLYRELKKY